MSIQHQNNDALQVFGYNVSHYRRKSGLTQVGLAMRAYVSSQTVSEIERGLRNPSLLTMIDIAQALHVPIADLLTEQDIQDVA